MFTQAEEDLFIAVDALLEKVAPAPATADKPQPNPEPEPSWYDRKAVELIDAADEAQAHWDDCNEAPHGYESLEWKCTKRGGYYRAGFYYGYSDRRDMPAQVAPCDDGFRVIYADRYILGVTETAAEGIARVLQTDDEGLPASARPIKPAKQGPKHTDWAANKKGDGHYRYYQGVMVTIKAAASGKLFYRANGHDGVHGWFDSLLACQKAADAWAATGFNSAPVTTTQRRPGHY
jgi:hypothetical protein